MRMHIRPFCASTLAILHGRKPVLQDGTHQQVIIPTISTSSYCRQLLCAVAPAVRDTQIEHIHAACMAQPAQRLEVCQLRASWAMRALHRSLQLMSDAKICSCCIHEQV
jgi:hypothetical protein